MLAALASLLLAHAPAGLTAPPAAGPCTEWTYVPPECAGRTYIRSLFVATPPEAPVPYDGVVLLQYMGDGPDLVDRIDATVTLGDVPVAGALETTDLANLLVWRPQAPFEPDATYHLTARFQNPDDVTACLLFPNSGVDQDFTTTREPAAPLTAPRPTGTQTFEQLRDVSLTGLACCPGASPTAFTHPCGYRVTDFDPDDCTPIAARGQLTVELTGPSAASGPAAAHTVYTTDIASPAPWLPVGTLAFTLVQNHPFCVAVTAHDLARGTALTGPEQCFGDAYADQLGGPHPLAPPATFTCELQQCEPKDDTWDLDKCTPGAATGCGCTTTTSPPLLALVVLLRRRRR